MCYSILKGALYSNKLSDFGFKYFKLNIIKVQLFFGGGGINLQENDQKFNTKASLSTPVEMRKY